MKRGQVFRLYPTKAQEDYFRRACGVARFAYNWALARWRRCHRLFGKSPGWMRLKKHFNKVKRRRFPWAAEVCKQASAEAIRRLGTAYTNFFEKRAAPPGYKKKGVHNSFCAADEPQCIRFMGNRVCLPVVGAVRFRNPLRWPGAVPKVARVCRRAGNWYLAVQFDGVPDPAPLPAGRSACGIDLGSTTFATVASGGKVVEGVKPPKPYAKAKRKLKRLQRAVSRKAKGGKNREKAKRRVARLLLRVANVRADFLHKLSRRLVRTYGTVVLEDLSVKGMARGIMAKAVGDLGWSEFRRQVEYKAAECGTRVVVADRLFPSSKRCHRCGRVRDSLGLSERFLWCPCGEMIDRDHNAALNLEQLAEGIGEVTPAETGGQAKRKPSRCRSEKREPGKARA